MTRRHDRLDGWADDPLVRALRAPATNGELDGYDAVAAEFRSHNPPVTRSRRRLFGHLGTGVTTIVTALALTGGVAAAYSRALPAPLQSAAHSLLGVAGVPAAIDDRRQGAAPSAHLVAKAHKSKQHGGSTSGTPPVAHGAAAAIASRPPNPHPAVAPAASPRPAPQSPTASAGPAQPQTEPQQPTPSQPQGQPQAEPQQPTPAQSTPAATTSPSPTPTASAAPKPAALSAKPGRARVPAQQRVAVRGVLTTDSGQPVAGHRVALDVRPAGQQAWNRVSSGRTAKDGSISLRTPTLSRTMQVRLVTPQGLHSPVTTVTVVPALTLTLQKSDDGKRYLVTVHVSGGETGDGLALARQRPDGTWARVRSAQLPESETVTFTVPVPAKSVSYRVRIVATQQHADGYGWFTATP